METADSTKPFLMKARIHFKLGEDSVLEPDVFSREAGAVVPVPEIKASEAENGKMVLQPRLCTLRSYVRSGWIWGGDDEHRNVVCKIYFFILS
ncbi:hypothetical protein NC653_019130 [Populus alba x Populus x berolinensis]|uniref:Uncharacterized protein n=1 Tax=Populus alba x Populus x berolinensis TaxID=444605 RepID=A0AAD6VWP5_9ROSI|nr:hypothetical protein NC653_019130 [Populus alba x Populus x berolinensis]